MKNAMFGLSVKFCKKFFKKLKVLLFKHFTVNQTESWYIYIYNCLVPGLWVKMCTICPPLFSFFFLQGGTSGARLYLSSQIKEALRVSSLTGTGFDLPVFPLVKSVYASTNNFLSQVRCQLLVFDLRPLHMDQH